MSQEQPAPPNLQQRLSALNRAIIHLMSMTTIDSLCEAAIRLGITTLGFDRLGLYFTIPGEPPRIAATYGTDAQGNVCSEKGIIRSLSEDDWLLTRPFIEECYAAVRYQTNLVLPNQGNELEILGQGWNAAAGLRDRERLIGYLFADNLLHKRPYTEDDGELLATYGLALGHLCARLQVEEELRQRQLNYRALLEAIPDLFFSLNRQGVFLDYHCPPNSYLLIGDAPIVGRSVYELLPPALAQQVLHAIEQSCETGECVTFEYTLPSGSEVHHFEARMVEAMDGIILTLVRNVTDRKFLEEQLIAGHKMESLGRMAGGIAHDFNNLLTVVQGYSSLADRFIEPQQPQLRKIISQIAAAGERGAQLTSQLLSVARRQVVEAQILEVNQVLQDMEGLLRQLLKSSVDLQVEPSAQHLHLRIARSQLEQLVLNLVTNADEAMPEGGQLVIRCRYLAINESAARRYLDARAGEYVLIEVIDNGSGINHSIIRNIFDPFFTTKQATKHSGLGLAICHGIVQQNGGHIAVQSTPHVATTFQIFLPYLHAKVAAPMVELPVSEQGGHESLLLVEDDADVRAITNELLANFGYQVIHFAKGAEAVAYAQQHPSAFDLLITDLVMPQMSGQEVAQAVLALRPKLPVLLMSGYVEEHPAVLVDFTRVDFLAKPFTTAALVGKVRALLDQG